MTAEEDALHIAQALFPGSSLVLDPQTNEILINTKLLIHELPSLMEASELRSCDGCGKIEPASTQPDQDGEGRSECCWETAAPAHEIPQDTLIAHMYEAHNWTEELTGTYQGVFTLHTDDHHDPHTSMTPHKHLA